MKKASLQIGDVYTLQERETGKWFAFQIVQIGEENAVYIDLDYWSEKIPEEKTKPTNAGHPSSFSHLMQRGSATWL